MNLGIFSPPLGGREVTALQLASAPLCRRPCNENNCRHLSVAISASHSVVTTSKMLNYPVQGWSLLSFQTYQQMYNYVKQTGVADCGDESTLFDFIQIGRLIQNTSENKTCGKHIQAFKHTSKLPRQYNNSF